ncbi:hypothetical protein FRACYDRAFT_253572 [Fragilariopsis cylindrus CCMP1102]|uniref:Helicase-associated domain-containing protein n=1 Tax=Fragilariopsis cylindrus CCMP1102 TaxID=635003 RepID=A0A1E7ELG9_9STRA|nr:hypothetical protein FRACYDRAFT_253572 [Fragilariopsis cylindrus CCMP1102]|eukprot:OEU06762.1 hypothetical protein FRACYDRAFT_253572 [Fragilariopsis cylindrus CCMP1102]
MTAATAAAAAVARAVAVVKGKGNNSESKSKTTETEDDYHWIMNFLSLKEFYNKYGHTNLLRSNNSSKGTQDGNQNNKLLMHWVKNQRSNYYNMNNNKSLLCQNKIDLLNKLNFIWYKNNCSWYNQYSRLLRFTKLYGHCTIPITTTTLTTLHDCSSLTKTKTTPNPFRNLALWKRRQQYLYYNIQKQKQISNSQQVSQRVGQQGQSSSTTTSTSTTTLTLDRIIALEKIPGWTWRY